MARTFRLRRRDGSIREGLSATDLRALARISEIHHDDLIADADSDAWTPAAKVKGLKISPNAVIPCLDTPANEATRKPAAAVQSGWRPVVQECRHYAPLIESSSGQGSGLLVSHDGLIVTNRHVVEGGRVFMVSFYDGTKAKALVIHRHAELDLAVLRCTIHTNTFFDLTSKVATGFDAGDEVIAIGHPRGLTFTSTRGIISEPSRILSDGEFVQTDVAINPGNSGGPLLDENGHLVGLNTQIEKDSQGLGFALPGCAVAEYFARVESLIQDGELSTPSDEDIALLDDVLSPAEVLEAALKSSPLEHRSHTYTDRSPGWIVTTPSGHSFLAQAGEDAFVLYMHVQDLSDYPLPDETLLRQMLRWQNEMSLVRFAIDDEDNLVMKVCRSGRDLDVSEAFSALLDMADDIEAMYQPIIDHLA